MVYFQFLVFLSLLLTLVKVLYIPEGWWLHAQVCCFSGARRQESLHYMLSVYNLPG